jgi:hypothetical protein
VYAQLVDGRRSVEFDRRHRWISDIELHGADEIGRELTALGRVVSHHGTRGPSGTGHFHWDWDGLEGWGEDQSYAAEEVWRSLGAP